MYGEDSHNYKWKQLRDIWDNDEEETSPKKKQTKMEEGGKAEDKKNQVAKEHPISNDWEFVEDETGPSSQAWQSIGKVLIELFSWKHILYVLL